MPADPKSKAAPGIVAALILGGALAGCGQADGDPEAEIRAWLADAELAVEERDRQALMTKIGAGYADARGLGPVEIDRLLGYHLLRHRALVLLTNIDAIRLFGDTAAEVAMTVGTAGSAGAPGLSANAWNVELELGKTGAEWQLIGAKWGRLGDELR